MLNLFKSDGSLKEYRASFVKQSTSENGNKTIRFCIASCKKNAEDEYEYTNYTVFTRQDLALKDNDKVVIKRVTAIDCDDYQNKEGKTVTPRKFWAEIDVIPSTPNRVEVVDNGDIFDDDNIDLPF